MGCPRRGVEVGRVRRLAIWGMLLGSIGAASAGPLLSQTADARHVARWVVETAENGERPYAIVDKRDARIYVYQSDGALVGVSAVLLGQTAGDLATPLGNRHPYSLPLEERTTPAGRFVSRPGHNDKGDPVIWFDHAAALAIHRLRPAPAVQRREARLESPTSDDNRISLGCVIVPVAFYDTVIATTLGRGRGVVYVLPEASPVQALFGPKTNDAVLAALASVDAPAY